MRRALPSERKFSPRCGKANPTNEIFTQDHPRRIGPEKRFFLDVSSPAGKAARKVGRGATIEESGSRVGETQRPRPASRRMTCG